MPMTMRWRVAMAFAACVSLAATPFQAPQVNHVMREKLEDAQKILAAVVTSDWVNLEAYSRQMERLTDDPRWAVLKYPEYAHQSATFRQAVRDLRSAAAQRDLENAPNAYVAVTLKCVECHRYLARQRIADERQR
jgi:hypothetical protein